jgi:hypothetical protein
MLGSIRAALNARPWIGYVLAGVLFAACVYFILRAGRGTDPYTPERMTEKVAIRFTDTDEVVEMTRGQLDKELRRRGDRLDPSQGIVNPKTGKPTGFLFSKSEWEEMIERINREKEEIRRSTGKQLPPVPREVPVPPSPPQGDAPSGKN